MATIVLTLAAPVATRIVTAITARYGYQATINGSPNPITPAEFTRLWIITQLKAAVREHESNTAAATAAANAGTDVDTNIVIT